MRIPHARRRRPHGGISLRGPSTTRHAGAPDRGYLLRHNTGERPQPSRPVTGRGCRPIMGWSMVVIAKMALAAETPSRAFDLVDVSIGSLAAPSYHAMGHRAYAKAKADSRRDD